MSIIDDSLGTFEIIKVSDSYIGENNSILTRDLSFDTETFSENSTQFRIVQTKHSRNRNSGNSIWNYFVFAEKINAEETNDERDTTSDRILCYLCFTKGVIQIYKKSTSSSNLWKHLGKKHNIKIPKEKVIYVKSKFDNGIDQLLDNSFIEEHVPDLFTENSNLEPTPIFNSNSDDALIDNSKITYNEGYKDVGLLLIQEIRKRPLLYEHRTNVKGSLKTKREEMWSEVHIAMDKIMEIDRLQKMWKNIRDRYKRIRNAEKQGMEQTQKYKYYNQLTFLNDENSNQIKAEPSDFIIEEIGPSAKRVRIDEYLHDTITMSSSSKYDDLNGTTAVDNNLIETYIQGQDTDANNIYCEPNKSNEQLTTVLNTFSSNTCCNEHLDEFDYFGRFIAFKLRAYPPSRVTEIQSKIIHFFE